MYFGCFRKISCFLLVKMVHLFSKKCPMCPAMLQVPTLPCYWLILCSIHTPYSIVSHCTWISQSINWIHTFTFLVFIELLSENLVFGRGVNPTLLWMRKTYPYRGYHCYIIHVSSSLNEGFNLFCMCLHCVKQIRGIIYNAIALY